MTKYLHNRCSSQLRAAIWDGSDEERCDGSEENLLQ